MKQLTLLFVMICSVSFSQTGENKSYLYLQNQSSGKIRKINLTSSYFVSYSVDSSESNYESYLNRDCYEPQRCRFETDSVSFHLDEVNYYYWQHRNDIETTDSWDHYYQYDTTVSLPYTDVSHGYDIYLSRQSKAGRVLFMAGCGIVYASLVNAFLIAPLRGLNQGSFEGYSTQRLWQGELYSGIGLSIGLPLMFIFDYKDYYFQNPSGTWDTWKVVEGMD